MHEFLLGRGEIVSKAGAKSWGRRRRKGERADQNQEYVDSRKASKVRTLSVRLPSFSPKNSSFIVALMVGNLDILGGGSRAS